MEFTKEQLAKAKAAKSAEELLALAKENDVELTENEAQKYFAELRKEGELAAEELDNVTGGCGTPSPRFQVGSRVYRNHRTSMSIGTGRDIYISGTVEGMNYYEASGWHYWVKFDDGTHCDCAEDSLSPS